MFMKTSGFFSFVEKTLSKCSPQSNLNKFKLNITYDDHFESQVNNWIRYALNRNVKILDLTLWPADEFMLHHFFYISSCFIHLKLRGCILNPSHAVSWNNLKTLNISNVKLDDDLIQNILSGSPLLETFKLTECYGFSRLDITSKTLNNLVFDGYFDPYDISLDLPLIISAPNILSLSIKYVLALEKLILLNVSSLVEANLNNSRSCHHEIRSEENREAEEEMLKGLILSLCHVKEFQIGISCSEQFY